MSDVKRRRILMGVCIAALLLAMAWCGSVLQDAHQRAMEAADDATKCQSLAGRIALLQKKPAVAGSREMQVTDLPLKAAESAAGITEANIVTIDPQSPRSVGQGMLAEELPMLLHEVTLQQCVEFLHAMGDAGSGLEVREIRLTSPQNGGGTTVWNADVTLEHLIYSPTAAGKSSGTEE